MLLVVVLLVPFVVSAQANPCTGGLQGNIGRCVTQVYLWSLGISGLLAVGMSVLGGYLIMSARGNGAQASKGKDFIYSSLIGIVLLAAAYLLLNTINPDLTKFNAQLSPGTNQASPRTNP